MLVNVHVTSILVKFRIMLGEYITESSTVSFGLLLCCISLTHFLFLFLSSFIVLVNVHAVKILVRSLKERGECNA